MEVEDAYLLIEESSMLEIEHVLAPAFQAVMDERKEDTYLAGMDVNQVQWIARESNSSSGSTLHDEGILVFYSPESAIIPESIIFLSSSVLNFLLPRCINPQLEDEITPLQSESRTYS